LSNEDESLRIVEAILFASDSPLSIFKINTILSDLNPSQIKEIIWKLNRKYMEENHSFTIREVASGYQIYTLPEYAPWVNQIWQDRKFQRLSQASLEALAVIAYHQPVLKAQIDKVRGVDCGGVLHTLLERNLIQTAGRESSWGRPILYGTTKEFLSYFGLNSLSELPKIEELETFLKEKESSKTRVEEKLKEKEESLQVNTEEEGVTMHERE